LIDRSDKVASFLDDLPSETSAFFLISFHRDELERAGYAFSFLRIVADPTVCETLVKRALPWQVVSCCEKSRKNHLYSVGANQVIRELANQAILRDDGMMAREIGYHGFGTAPLLSDALFSDEFILERYNPFNSFFSVGSDKQLLKVGPVGRSAGGIHHRHRESGSEPSRHGPDSFYIAEAASYCVSRELNS